MKQWKAEGYKVFAEDEASISLNPSSRKPWAPRGSKPLQLVNGSKQAVKFFGVVSEKKTHCCTAEWFNEDTFIRFVKYLLRLYRKLVLIADLATCHFTSKKVKEFVRSARRRLILWPLPKKLPQPNPQEQGWKSARSNVTYKLFPTKKGVAQAVQAHLRKEFRIELAKFWS